jgi:hypothetical protein
MRRLTVQFTDEQWELIDIVAMGNTDAEKVRNIVISWLAEKSLISTSAKKKLEHKK